MGPIPYAADAGVVVLGFALLVGSAPCDDVVEVWMELDDVDCVVFIVVVVGMEVVYAELVDVDWIVGLDDELWPDEDVDTCPFL